MTYQPSRDLAIGQCRLKSFMRQIRNPTAIRSIDIEVLDQVPHTPFLDTSVSRGVFLPL